MKLLFDENLSYKIVSLVKSQFPEASHVSARNLQQASDREIWAFAKKNHFTLVTKDSDFAELSHLMGPEPKVIWLKLGNCSNEAVAKALTSNKAKIQTAFSEQHIFCLELF